MEKRQIKFIALVIILFTLMQSAYLYGIYLPKYSEDAVILFEDIKYDSLGNHYFIQFGTGFLVSDTIIDAIFIVTNRHILVNRDSLNVRINSSDGNLYKFIIQLKNSDGTPKWLEHPNKNIDLAIMALKTTFSKRAFDVSRFKTLEKLSLGDEILFIGFPSLPLENFTGMKKNCPVVRSGVVAYIAQEDIYVYGNKENPYIPKGVFLIDSKSIGGNSGSPVLSTSQYVPLKDKASLIGIVYKHIPGASGENLDLAHVIPVDRLQELIDLFYENLEFNLSHKSVMFEP